VKRDLIFVHLADELDKPDNTGQAHVAAKPMYDLCRVFQNFHLAFDHQIDSTLPGDGVQVRKICIQDNDIHVFPLQESGQFQLKETE
jgi:hypothetical protein